MRRDGNLDRVEIFTALFIFFVALVFIFANYAWSLACSWIRAASFWASSWGLTLFRDFVHSNIFKVGSCEAVHDLVVCVTLLTIKTQLVTCKNHPMLFVALRLCFQVAIAFMLDDVFVRNIIKAAKSLKDLLIWCFWAIKSSRTRP